LLVDEDLGGHDATEAIGMGIPDALSCHGLQGGHQAVQPVVLHRRCWGILRECRGYGGVGGGAGGGGGGVGPRRGDGPEGMGMGQGGVIFWRPVSFWKGELLDDRGGSNLDNSGNGGCGGGGYWRGQRLRGGTGAGRRGYDAEPLRRGGARGGFGILVAADGADVRPEGLVGAGAEHAGGLEHGPQGLRTTLEGAPPWGREGDAEQQHQGPAHRVLDGWRSIDRFVRGGGGHGACEFTQSREELGPQSGPQPRDLGQRVDHTDCPCDRELGGGLEGEEEVRDEPLGGRLEFRGLIGLGDGVRVPVEVLALDGERLEAGVLVEGDQRGSSRGSLEEYGGDEALEEVSEENVPVDREVPQVSLECPQRLGVKHQVLGGRALGGVELRDKPP